MFDLSFVMLQATPGGMAPWLLAAVTGYFLGSIPFGLILTRAAGLGDVRSIGSGNIGATNVLRTGNKGLAAATLLLDGLKATAAALLVYWFVARSGGANGETLRVAALAGGAALIGHIFPIWLGFKGGKGVATYIGAALGVHWPLALVFCATWLATAFATRISSLSALVAAVVLPIYAFLTMDRWIAGLFAVLSIIVIAMHHANIKRLLAGAEPKIGAKK